MRFVGVANAEILALLDCGDYAAAAVLIERLKPDSIERKTLWSEMLWVRRQLNELEQFTASDLDPLVEAEKYLRVLNLSRVLYQSGEYARVLELVVPILDDESASPVDRFVRANLHVHAGCSWFTLRQHEKAIPNFRHAIRLYTEEGSPRRVPGCLLLLGRVEIAAGRWTRGLSILQRALESAYSIGDPFPINGALLNLGTALLFRGWFEAAEPPLQKSLRISEEQGKSTVVALRQVAVGLWAVRTYRLELAAECLISALRASRAAAERRTEALALEYLSELALARGRWNSSRLWSRKAIEVGQAIRDSSIVGQATVRLAEAELAVGNASTAYELAKDAQATFESFGDPYEAAVATRVVAQSLSVQGKWSQSRRRLGSAAEFLASIDERFESKRIALLADAIERRLSITDIRAEEGRSTEVGTPAAAEPKSFNRVTVARTRKSNHLVTPRGAIHHPDFPEVLGTAPPLLALLEEVKRYATLDCSVLIEGETGTGKELIARSIHRLSSRSAGEFVPFNSGTSTPEVFDAEVFGHIRGAFTGAVSNRDGLARTAHRGTLFLDEIAELSLELQPRFLRLLDSGEVRPVGADRSDAVNLRVLAATHRDLHALVQAGRFRQDLLYRLVATRLRIPPLRERYGDLEILVPHFVAESQRWKPSFKGVSDRVLTAMANYAWPGNVRELRNEVTRLAAVTDEGIAQDWRPATSRRDEDLTPESLDRESLEAELRRAQGSVTAVAERFGVSRSRVYRLIKELEIQLSHFRPTR